MSTSSINPAVNAEIIDVEYDALESALLKTGRGRAFLSEHARRNRLADTQTVLTAIERLEGTMRAQDPIADVQRFRGDVLEMARRIAETRQQIVSLHAEDESDSAISRAKGELDAIVQATESATGGILAATEEIQEIAWTLRESGFAAETCEAIDERATNIYLACSFQDLTSQRIRKVIDAMQFLESRINQMIDIWGFSKEELALPSSTAPALAGPTADGLKQDEVDIAMVGAARAERQSTAFELGSDSDFPPADDFAARDEAVSAEEPLADHSAEATVHDVISVADIQANRPSPAAEPTPMAFTPDSDAGLIDAMDAPVTFGGEGDNAAEQADSVLKTAEVDDELQPLQKRFAPLDDLSARSRLQDFE